MEQFERIRRDQRDEGLSVRALAARHRVHRRTVRQALEDAVPPAPKAPVRVSPALGPHEATVRGWLVADLDAPRKQRHTARRVWRNLPHWHRPGPTSTCAAIMHYQLEKVDPRSSGQCRVFGA